MFMRKLITVLDMPRNIDLTALRAFVAVADAGGVTRAAGLLHLTQSAVSMQIRRLEDMLGQPLFLRASRKLTPTAEGEQLLSYGRRMLALNDEVLSRFSMTAPTGSIRLGVPHDIVYPAIPNILKALAGCYPGVRINLVSSFTLTLKEGLSRGDFDVILTTEEAPPPEAEILSARDLVWIGAPDGVIWQQRPLRLACKDVCIFRHSALAALEKAGLPWELAVDTDSEQVVEATVAADLAVSVRMDGALPEGTVKLNTGNMLPPLGSTKICLYHTDQRKDEAMAMLLAHLRDSYGSRPASIVTTILPMAPRPASVA